MSFMQTKRHASLDTGLGADSITLLDDITKQDDTSSQRAIIGTYALQEDTNAAVREGQLLQVRAARNGESCTLELETVVRGLPGVLDVGMDHTEQLLYVACAEDGLFAFDASQGAVCKRRKVREGNCDERIVLAVDVDRDEEGEGSCLVGESDSEGGIALHRIGERGWEKVERWDAHKEEAWSVSVDASGRGVYSGGDDGSLVCNGIGEGERFRLRDAHAGVGVTCVRREGEWRLWSGGYDDTVRIWDIRAMRRSVMELEVGGGVWRIRVHPKDPEFVLSAAMYDGFKVLRRRENLEVVAEYRGHDSLAYGASWVPGLDQEGEFVALTGSFYDHSLQLWSVEVGD